MKSRLSILILALVGLAMVAPQAAAKGKPVIASIIMQDLDSMMKTADAWTAEFGDTQQKMGFGIAKNMIKHSDALKGIDTSRPMGILVQWNDDHKPEGLMALPVKDWDAVKSTIKKYAKSTEEVNDHIRKVKCPFDKTVYIRKADRWLLVAEHADILSGSLDNLAEAVKGIPPSKDKTVQINIHVNKIPEKCFDAIQEKCKAKAQQCNAKHGSGCRELDAMCRRISHCVADRLADRLKDIQTISMSMTADKGPLRMAASMKVTAKPGTPMAKYFHKLGNTKSNLVNMVDPATAKNIIAAGGCHGSLPGLLKDSEIEHIGKAWRKVAMAKLMKKHKGKAADQAEELVDGMLTLVHKFLDKNTIDQTCILTCEPDSLPVMLGGRYVADGYLLEKNMGIMVEAAKAHHPKCAKYIKLKTNVDDWDGVHVHQITIKPPKECKDKPLVQHLPKGKLTIVVGFGPERVFVAAGDKAKAQLKAAVKRVQTKDAKPVMGNMGFIISISNVLELAARCEDEKVKTIATKLLEATDSSDGKGSFLTDTIFMNVKAQGNSIESQFSVGADAIKVMKVAHELKKKHKEKKAHDKKGGHDHDHHDHDHGHDH